MHVVSAGGFGGPRIGQGKVELGSRNAEWGMGNSERSKEKLKAESSKERFNSEGMGHRALFMEQREAEVGRLGSKLSDT